MNPILLANEVEQRYHRYLRTTFYFKDPLFRESFFKALDSGRLSQGPFLEATPVFSRGRTPRELFAQILKTPPDEGFLKALHGDRSLYKHQEQAIEAVSKGYNVIVATGTGSGKTESFLFPILLHLYQEFLKDELTPGVRALILYPMNALANDQRERLGNICKQLKETNSPFHFTFGQYVGSTPDNENDSRRYAQDHLAEREQSNYSIIENGRIIHGEMVLRSEMRENPPHILLTNYSMLEYLLLRPDDSPLFDNGRAKWWSFLVLDEAHQYRGAQGIEMSMLLRRLKQRLREGGRNESFRCIATSATIAGGSDDKALVAKFASDLFDEEFLEQNVIMGEIESIKEQSSTSLTFNDYRLLQNLLNTNEIDDTIEKIASNLGVVIKTDESTEKTLGHILLADKRATDLRKQIEAEPYEVNKLANILFEDLSHDERIQALSLLVDLLLKARDPETDAPLLSARYHLFLRALEGAFVSYWPEKRVYLDRKTIGEKITAFEVALCRECGQHYFVVQKNFSGGKLQEAVKDPNDINFGATFLRPIEEEDLENEGNENLYQRNIYYLCGRCGESSRTRPSCGHSEVIRVIKEESPDDIDKPDQVKRCGACGYNAAGRDPVRELIHGADGPHAVIATTLYKSLPEGRKKVLAFADGRQEAAFFAWYLEETYKDLLHRNLLLNVAHKLDSRSEEGLSFEELASTLLAIYKEKKVFPPATGSIALKQQAWRAIYREFLTNEKRISLEGVGLVRWSVKWPDWYKTPEIFFNEPWNLSQQEANDLVFILLDMMRADNAVELKSESGVTMNWEELNLPSEQMACRIGNPRRNNKVRSWDGQAGRRAKFLTKLILKKNNNLTESEALQKAIEALRSVWESFLLNEKAIANDDRLLLQVSGAKRLNPSWWRLSLIRDDTPVFQCNTCGRLQSVSVYGVCTRHNCPGTLERVKPKELEQNHYYSIYKEKLPGVLRVEEHTAQLDKELASEFQREFKQNKINVLSCSTTFELGVDLGDLDTIFLRNVPPEAFNYAQRVGRSGRRTGFPGFAITFCRRSPHDLYHFAKPERMLSGKVKPPVLKIKNEKIILRHITAFALSFFFRKFPERFKNVENLFVNLKIPKARKLLIDFLKKHQIELENSLKQIVPGEVMSLYDLSKGAWIDKITGENSRFFEVELEVSSDYKNVLHLEILSRLKSDYKIAQWAKSRRHTISSEDVLSFLSRKTVIPKYGFPVDVVELDTQRIQYNKSAFEVLLQRDLSIAISEFAPGSKLFANKKVWTSYGLKRVVDKEWASRFYKRCRQHNVFLQWKPGEPEPELPCEHHTLFEPPRKYVIPSFGFLTDFKGPESPKTRTSKSLTTRPYFAGSVGPDPGIIQFPNNSNEPLLKLRKASPGLMVVLCEGKREQGFYICSKCGAGFQKNQRQHKTPYGKICHGTLELVSLGHEFVTDVIQLQFLEKYNSDVDPIWFGYSLAFALVEGAAEVLDIPSTDLNATVAHAEQFPVPPIIIYDSVPGGAGLVGQLEDEKILKACLVSALQRVSGRCGCDANTSCYGCLRSYRNQFAHRHLQRGPVMNYLTNILATWRD